MRFPPSFLDELRARLPVSEVVGRRVKLRKAGREWKGLSPFNKEKTPSFFVNDQKMAWFDFSSGKNGNIFDFVMQTEGVSFPEAVERLAAQAGLPLPKVSREEEAREQYQRTLYDVLELAAKFFEKTLTSLRGAKARGYLSDRGIRPATQLEFRMGYASPDRFALKEHLAAQGVSVADMVEAGLLVAGDDIPVPYDRFRDRIIIPIHDQRGRVVAFGGRALAADAQPKYLNSPETTLFHKGAVLFNFHRARQPAHNDGSVVVVEGYLDAISIYQAGIRSVVASMGTALTEEQIANLWRLSSEPIVCFDADRAGISAAHRSIDRILPLLKVGSAFRFAFLKEGKDPDELIRESGVEAFKSVIAASLPLWDVLWKREIASARVQTPGGQVALEQRLTSVILNIRDPVVRKSYQNISRMELARLFWQVVKGNQRNKSGIDLTNLGNRRGVQKILLGLLVQYPEFVEDKAEVVFKVHFDPVLAEFWSELYDLLITSQHISVQIIYERLTPRFFAVLNDIHGEKTPDRERGYKLALRFPIVKFDPPHDFISRCIDHFARMLLVQQMGIEIDERTTATSSDNDLEGERLLALIREFQLQSAVIDTTEIALAEEATNLKRMGNPAEWGQAA
jgi:DNA primase